MPKVTIIVQTQSASGFQGEMVKKSLKQLTQLLVTITNILAHGDVPQKTAQSTHSTLLIIPYTDKKMREVLSRFSRLTPRREHKKSGIISLKKI